jgi:acetyl esterase/lipase
MSMGRRAQIARRAAAALAACALAGALATAEAAGAISQLDVSYDLGTPVSPPSRNSLDVYRPDGSSPADARPVVVYVHGGGWMRGDKRNRITDKVNLFTGAGYVFVSLNYRLSPDPPDTSYPPDRIRFPAHPDDVGEAIGWIDRNVAAYGGDPTRILLIGHSAGAHLVSLVSTDPRYVTRHGVEPWQLIGTVALDGDAYDVADRISEVGPASAPTFLSAFATPEENALDGTWATASPELWADPSDPDHLIVTQAAAPGRIADAEELAVALGMDPTTSVFRAPYDHAGINAAVGGDDPAGETAAILDFYARVLGNAEKPRARFRAKPGKRVRAQGRRAKVRFRFGSNVAGSKFECRLDGKRYRSCRSPRVIRVERGRHTFRVRAVSPSGRTGPAASFRFRVLQARCVLFSRFSLQSVLLE